MYLQGAPRRQARGEAQSLGLTTGATNVIGFGEDNAARGTCPVVEISKIVPSHSTTYWFHVFYCLAGQLEVNSFGRRNRLRASTFSITGTEYLRHVALSRLFLDNVEHIQASDDHGACMYE